MLVGILLYMLNMLLLYNTINNIFGFFFPIVVVEGYLLGIGGYILSVKFFIQRRNIGVLRICVVKIRILIKIAQTFYFGK